MVSLPRGVAVYENVQAAQYEGPAILKLLKEMQLSGYARFQFFQAAAHLLFTDGNLIHLVLETKDAALTGLEGVTKLFELIVREGGRLDVFRLSPTLTRHVLGFLRGSRIHEAQALKLLDRKALLESIRLEKLTGALRIYTSDRSSMIFYEEGL
ncbi:MAG TPA: GTPase-activating protein, partial [Thermoanaerobaculia bacterium]